MASKRILICDACGKKEKKDATGWISFRLDINLFDKKRYYWYKRGVKDDFYASKDFCSVKCLDTYLNGLVLSGKIAGKVVKLQESQKKEKDME